MTATVSHVATTDAWNLNTPIEIAACARMF